MERFSLAELDTFPQRGRGEYGMVVLTPRGAAKVTPYKLTLPGSRFSPFHCVNAEWLIQRALSDLPHVVPAYRSYVIDGAPLRTLRHESAAPSHSRVIEMKDYPCRDFPRYFQNNPLREDVSPDDFFKGVLFQVAFTLQQIYCRFPAFRHNDLSVRNLMVDEKAPPTEYDLPELGLRFRVPSAGYSIAIGDFDFASISGVVDNYKVLEVRAGYRAFTVGSELNHKADLFRVTCELYALLCHDLSAELRRSLELFFNGTLSVDLYDNSFYATEAQLRRAPTVLDFLLGFFPCEKRPPVKSAPPASISLADFTKEVRAVPLLMARDPRGDFPAKAYFERIESDSLPPARFIADYPHGKVQQLISQMQQVYFDSKPIHKRVRRFLATHLVPDTLLPLCVLHAYIDAHRRQENVRLGHEYLWELDVTEDEFIQFSLQWSWQIKA